MFLGLRTAIYYVQDIESAKAWYCKALGCDPYFDQPFYVGFNVGGYELGLHPDEGLPVTKHAGVVTYWGVEDAQAAVRHLVQLGATVHQDISDVGEGILVASVLDPFGNVFGVIKNPHFKLQGD